MRYNFYCIDIKSIGLAVVERNHLAPIKKSASEQRAGLSDFTRQLVIDTYTCNICYIGALYAGKTDSLASRFFTEPQKYSAHLNMP